MDEKHKQLHQGGRPGLEIVLKCDSVGSLEAATHAIGEIGEDISIIHSGIGNIGKSDVLPAETAGKLIVGFQVDTLPGIDKLLRKSGVEVRLYNVIFELTAGLKGIAESLLPSPSQEQILGSARIIALFKGGRKGIIIGCEVTEGSLSIGRNFRIISAMGPVYSARIESMHIGQDPVQKAVRGQQVGIKIENFKDPKVGDIVEAFHSLSQEIRPWRPSGTIIRK